MIFDDFSYIKTEPLSGDIRTDVKNILLINGKSNTYNDNWIAAYEQLKNMREME